MNSARQSLQHRGSRMVVRLLDNPVSTVRSGVGASINNRIVVEGLHFLPWRIRRGMATSAQKRKLQEKRIWKSRGGQKVNLNEAAAPGEETAFTNNNNHSRTPKERHDDEPNNGEKNWRPLFFLGVFPMLMSTLVVMTKQDLLS